MQGFSTNMSVGVVVHMVGMLPSLFPPVMLCVQGTPQRHVVDTMHRECLAQDYQVLIPHNIGVSSVKCKQGEVRLTMVD